LASACDEASTPTQDTAGSISDRATGQQDGVLAGQAPAENANTSGAAVPAAEEPSEEDKKRMKELAALPGEIRDYMMRRAGCNHWMSEPWPDDDKDEASRDRRAQIEEAIKEMRCEQLDEEKLALAKCYADIPRVRLWLDVAGSWFSGDPMVEYLGALPHAPAPEKACFSAT
jgi:hypothetical protein